MKHRLPQAIRSRFCHLISEGLSAREAARRLKLSLATGVRWAQSIRTHGSITAKAMGRPSGTSKLVFFVGFLKELIAQDPDITLYELRDALSFAHGVKVQHTTIWRRLRALGFTYKKIVGCDRTSSTTAHKAPT